MEYKDAEHDVWVDPVSHREVDPSISQHESFYAGRHYHFADLTSKQTFDEDPQLWVSTPHASETSASLSPTGEPEN
jgi:YHS domain-containing protein